MNNCSNLAWKLKRGRGGGRRGGEAGGQLWIFGVGRVESTGEMRRETRRRREEEEGGEEGDQTGDGVQEG